MEMGSSLRCALPVFEPAAAPEPQDHYEAEKCRYFPKTKMFTRENNFKQLDVESLFFAFYFQQGSYQQYLSAIELKRRGWKFHIRFQTWLKRDETKTKGKPRTLYFDFENEWKVRVNTNSELNIADEAAFENELSVENLDTQTKL